MTIEATLERIAVALERIADSQNTITSIEQPVAVADVASEQPVAAKRGRGRPRKETAVETPVVTAPGADLPVAAPVLVVEDNFLDLPATIQPTKVFTKDDVRNALIAFQGKQGKDATFALIKKYGGTNLNDIPENQYPGLVDEAEKGSK